MHACMRVSVMRVLDIHLLVIISCFCSGLSDAVNSLIKEARL